MILPNTLGSNISCTFRGLAFLSKECALLECRSGRREPNEEIGTSETRKKDTNAKGVGEEGREEEEVEVDRRRRRGRINRRESDSGQPNASRHCPRLFAPLSLSRGLPLRSCTLCICFKYRRSARSLWELPRPFLFCLPCAKKRQRARRGAQEGESRRNERWRMSAERERERGAQNSLTVDCPLVAIGGSH